MRAVLCVMLVCASAAFAAPAADSRQSERERMVAEQIAARGIEHPPTLAAMRKVPRHRFVPASVAASAYDDSPLPIGHGQTISQPLIVAFMTQAAQITRDSRVLEIGTGSGYQAAVAAELSDHVYSIEIVPPLAERAATALEETGYTRVQLRAGDGYHGWAGHAPFDVIIVTAAADTIPPPLVAQLKEGGRMVIPVGPQFGAQNLVLVTKQDGKLRTRTLMPVRFVPFTRAQDSRRANPAPRRHRGSSRNAAGNSLGRPHSARHRSRAHSEPGHSQHRHSHHRHSEPARFDHAHSEPAHSEPGSLTPFRPRRLSRTRAIVIY